MKNEIDELLSKATQQARERAGDEDRLEESASRVWEKIETAASPEASPSSSGCNRFASLLPAYKNGTLDSAQVTLLEEHLKECFSCRSRLHRLESGKPEAEAVTPLPNRGFPAWMRWGSIAAGVVVMIITSQFLYWGGRLPLVSADALTVSGLEGSLYALDGRDITPVSPGEVLPYGQTLRTGPETRALVTLRDGSEMELDERTEFDLVGGWRGDSIRLNRGNLIIRASDQGSGRLQVVTGDCDVEVKGTIFSVRHGLKGSRVSVVEGEVWVTKEGENEILRAGDQYTSRSGLDLRAVEEEISWSRNSLEYLDLLASATRIHQAVKEVTNSEVLRYSGSLARLLPARTILYGAAPNVIDRADLIFQAIEEAATENPGISEFWNSAKGEEIQSLLAEIRTLVYQMEGLFGDELVFAVSLSGEGKPHPVILAEVGNPSALAAEIERLNDRLSAESGEIRPFAVISDPFGSNLPDSPFFAWCDNGLFTLSPSLDLLRQVAEAESRGGSGGFQSNPFWETIATQYDQGVDWLLAGDFQAMLAAGEDEETINPTNAYLSPLPGIESLVAGRKLVGGEPESRIILNFNGQPLGVLDWLAEPMPMGAMDFVSPDASMAAGLSLRDPLEIMDELINHLAASGSEALDELDQVQAQIGLDVRDDLAASLGGEALFAIDGPVLPSPAWKVILEVYDETRLQTAIEYLANSINARSAPEEGQNRLALYAEEVGGHTLYTLQALRTGSSISYLFARGYMIAAPDYSAISRALQYQSSGYSLAHSPDFMAALPSGTSVDLSAFYYHDFRSVLDSVRQTASAAGLDTHEWTSFLEGNSSPFMTSICRTDSELIISSNSNVEDCLAWMGIMHGLKSMIQERIDQE